uniref:YfcC family protein n=2 Tax=Spiroplasma platyhelix TaxID=301585 RepID=A0A846U1A6_9MOLU|nr:YfcC family protein [Spiroplasma platyhelix PALS-1]
MFTAFTMLLLIIFVIIIISWILNGVGLTTDHHNPDGTSEVIKIGAAGIIDLFWAPMQGFIQKADIIIFILTIGAFINLLLVSKSLIGSAQWITRKLKGKELWAILPLMVFFSICGSVEGMAEESLGFYMVAIPLMIAAGFDTFTGLMIVLLGAGVGVIGSTVNPFLITVSVNAIKDSGYDINAGDGLVWRMVSWLVLTAVVISFVMIYAAKVKKNNKISITFSTAKADKEYFLQSASEVVVMDWRKNTSLAVFGLTLAVMIVYLIGWDAILGIDNFQRAGEWMNKNIPWMTAFIPGFGLGGLQDVAAFFLVSSVIVGAINWRSESEFWQKYLAGASDILSVCLIIATAAGVGIILQRTYMQDLIVNGLSSAVSGLNSIVLLVILFILFLPLSFLIPSTSGFASAIFPILGPVLMTMPNSDVTGSGAITAFSFASGILNLFTPTSGVVMGALAISRISYDKLLKGIWPLLLILAATSIILLVLGGLIGGTIF